MGSFESDKRILAKLVEARIINSFGDNEVWETGYAYLQESGRAKTLAFSKQMSIPEQVWELDHLESLAIFLNANDSLPPGIGKLKGLQNLTVTGNPDVRDEGLRFIPEELENLTGLKTIDLSNNQISIIPPFVAKLNIQRVELSGNPLIEPYASLADDGWPRLQHYLLSIGEGIPSYEAKVILVGEGGVGKTSLLAALRGEDFIENREMTHGIEINTLAIDHPSDEVEEELYLNFWDFGGQEVYRITHQFFFSSQALYLLVWKPREGTEENSLLGWLHRIRIRTGSDVKILIVATHADKTIADLDYPSLREEFGDMLAGHLSVDSCSGQGLSELLRTIRSVCGHFPQSQVPFNIRWRNARVSVLSRSETYIKIDDFFRDVSLNGLGEDDARSLLRTLHTFGHVVYWNVDGLRDFVVIKPEWVTKAIGLVLADDQTSKDDGVLNHHRLSEIWYDHELHDEPRYPPHLFPFFLRLMEQYDISARNPDSDESLVAQAVPHAKPTIPWGAESWVGSGLGMGLSCLLPHSPPGLVAWVTVRNHRWSTGVHWRKGVFLRHEDGHEALLELKDHLGAKEFFITVRGRHPSHFASLLRDGVERLLADRWRWLAWPKKKYKFMVPCEQEQCAGRFPLMFLLDIVEDGTVRCQECRCKCSIVRLLYGHDVSRGDVGQQMESLIDGQSAMMNHLEYAKAERQLYAAQSAELTRRVLQGVLSDASRGPRFFSLRPVELSKWRPQRLSKQRYRLCLWCEHSGYEHVVPGAVWEFSKEKKWLARFAPYATFVARCLRILVPVAAAAAGAPLAGIPSELKPDLQFADKLRQFLPDGTSSPDSGTLEINRVNLTAEAKGLRMLHDLLEELGWKQGQHGLSRVVSPITGDVLWVCDQHRLVYDPGLPELPPPLVSR